MKCPYVGLTPYSRDDAEFFFGREEEREVIALNLLSSSLTLVYGASGAGKSSVLGAGVENDLRRRAVADLVRGRRPKFVPLLFRSWQQAPLAILKRRIAESVRELKSAALEEMQGARGAKADGEVREAVASYGNGLRPPEGRLIEVLESWASQLHCVFLIILDQFEEFFFYNGRKTVKEAFADELAEAVNHTQMTCNFVISIREDALSKLDFLESRIPNLFQNKYPVRYLTRAQAEDAIKGPIDKFNLLYRNGVEPVAIEDRLVEAVLRGIRISRVRRERPGETSRPAEPDAEEVGFEAPLLQLIMQRLWNETAQGAAGLRLKTLRGMGGVEHLVEDHVDHVIKGLKSAEREVIARVFSHLVTPSGNKIAQRLTDLKSWSRDFKEPLEPLLERLCKDPARILSPLTLSTGAVEKDKYYQISHDILAPAILAWRDRYERAEMEKKLEEENRSKYRAYSRELAAAAVNNLMSDPELSLLLALYATQVGMQVGEPATEESEEALLNAIQASRVRLTLRGHGARLHAVAFDREGGRLVTSGEDGAAVCWDARTGRKLKALRGHKGWVLSAAFSPGGEQVITAGEDGTVRTWCVRTRRTLRRFKLSDGPINSVAYDGEGGRFAAGGEDGKIWVYELGGKRAPLVLSKHTGSVDRVAFSPDGRLLASVGEDAKIRLWHSKSGRRAAELHDQLRGHKDRIKVVVFSKDGALLATGSHDGTAKVWELPEGRLKSSIPVGYYWITGIDFSPDGMRLVTVGKTKSAATVWDIESAQPLLTLLGHEADVRGVAFSPDGSRVATASLDHTAKVWHVLEDEQLILQSHCDEVKGVAFSPDGAVIATGSKDRTVKIWDAATGQMLHALEGHGGDISGVTFSPDGRTLATVNWDGTVRLWEVSSGRQVLVQRLKEHLLAAAFSSDGSHLATSGTDKTCVIWRLVRGRQGLSLRAQRRLHGHSKWVNALTYSPDGALLASSSDDKSLRVWDSQSGEELRCLKGGDFFQGVAFARFGRRPVLLGASHNGTLAVWDFSAKGQPCHQLQVNTKSLHHVAASPDGRLAATAGEDCTVRVWDVEARKLLTTMRGHADVVWYVAFSPDGSELATAGLDKTARVWKVATGEERLVLNTSENYSKVYHPDPETRLYGLDLASMQEMAIRHLTRSFTEKEGKKYLHLDEGGDIPDPRRLAVKPARSRLTQQRAGRGRRG